jgi:phosphopantetheinyl transferase (holo-ACP synthase)
LLEGLLPPGVVARRLEPFDEGFLDQGFAIWKRVLAHMVLDAAELKTFYALPASGPRREEWLMGRVAAKDAARQWLAALPLALAAADVHVASDAAGAPQLRIGAHTGPTPAVSISHSRRWGVAAVAPPGARLGIDYQRLDGIDLEAVARGALNAAEQALIAAQSGPARARAIAALWSAKEAAAKASGLGLQGRPQDWHVIRYAGDATIAGADVEHGGQRYAVMIHFIEGREVFALCLA